MGGIEIGLDDSQFFSFMSTFVFAFYISKVLFFGVGNHFSWGFIFWGRFFFLDGSLFRSFFCFTRKYSTLLPFYILIVIDTVPF